MTKILHVDSSSRSEHSVTRLLSTYLVDALKASDPSSQVKHLDLPALHTPYVTADGIAAVYTSPAQRTEVQQKALQATEHYVDDVVVSDIYVFGVPMYNFTVPAVFKAFIDLIVVPGKTFSYENGVPKALLTKKKAYVLVASGGNYEQPPMANMDFLEPYLRTIFGFLGVTDITFIRASGHSPEEIAAATDHAKAQIDSLVGKKASVAV